MESSVEFWDLAWKISQAALIVPVQKKRLLSLLPSFPARVSNFAFLVLWFFEFSISVLYVRFSARCH